jgi:branched-chain amino acid transport system permease protein
MALYEQLLINGLVTGGIYVLVAIGLTIVFGVLNVVNFAHGEFYMLGGYFALLVGITVGAPLPVALVAAMAGGAAVGIITERLVFRPTQGQLRSDTIISSFGLAVVLQNASLLILGPQPKLITTSMGRTVVKIFDAYVSLQRIIIPAIAAVLVGLLHVLLRYTWMGRTLRAVSQQPTVASIVGVDVDRVAMIAFGVASAMAAGAGALMGTIFLMQPTIGGAITLKAFTVVILGGMGNVNGVIGAGLLLGVVESFAAGLVGNQWKDIVAFALVIAVLMLRPQGLFNIKSARA